MGFYGFVGLKMMLWDRNEELHDAYHSVGE